MVERVAAYADKYGMLPRAGTVLACVSGGADSMALLDALRELSPRFGFSVKAAHFDHGLRGGESDRDREFVAEYCKNRGVLCHVGYGDTTEYAKSHGLGIEEAARELRYAFFKRISESLGGAVIATAHNADDNAETVLLNLARGSGTRGLAGIPPVRDGIIRPLLCITRADIEKYLQERGVPFVTDSTNSSDKYARNRLRGGVMPVMRGINAAFAEHTLEAGERLRRDDEYLFLLAEGFVREHIKEDGGVPSLSLSALPLPVATRALTLLAGGPLTSAHVSDVLSLCEKTDGSASVFTSRGEFIRRYDMLFLKKTGTAETFAPVELIPGGSCEIPGFKVSCTELIYDSGCEISQNSSGIINKSFNLFLFKKSDICGRIIVRPRAAGDFIKIKGRGVSKSLKKLFIEARVPKDRRGLVPVLADDIGPLAVAGVCSGARAAPESGDVIYKICFERTENA